jgi:hypothetical protein
MQRQLAERGGLQRQLLQLLLLGMRDAAEQLRATATATKANTNLACALASNVVSALNCNTALHPALQAELRRSGGRQLLQDAAALVQALPVRLGGGLETAEGSRALVQGIALPVTLWQLMAPDLEQAQQAQRRSAGREAGLLPDDIVLWAVQQMPSAMAGMRLAAAAAESVLPRGREHTLIVGACNWANLLPKLESHIGTAAQLEAWTAALDSGLRLAPVLADLELRWRQLSLPLPGMAEGARSLSNSIALLWTNYLLAALAYVSRQFAAGSAVSRNEQRLLWQIHSTSCRLVHWAAAAASEEQRQALSMLCSVELQLTCLAKSFLGCYRAMVLRPDGSEDAAAPVADRQVLLTCTAPAATAFH